MSRLQNYIQNRWKRHVMDVKRSKGMYSDYKDFARFVAEEAQEAKDPIYGRWSQKQGATKSRWKSP